MTATLQRIVNHRGFGFAELSDSGDEVFIHANEYDGDFADLNVGDTIEIEKLIQTPKGLQARGVTRA